MENAISAWNLQFRTKLLLFAWHNLRIQEANDVQIIRLDPNGFVLRVYVDQRSTDCVHLFTKTEKNVDIDKSLHAALSSSEYLHHLPPHSNHALLLIAVMALCSTPYDSLPLFFHSTKRLFMLLVRSDQIAQTMLLLSVIIHVLEALYVLYVVAPMLSSFLAKAQWLCYSIILGFPCTARAMALSQASRHRSSLHSVTRPLER